MKLSAAYDPLFHLIFFKSNQLKPFLFPYQKTFSKSWPPASSLSPTRKRVDLFNRFVLSFLTCLCLTGPSTPTSGRHFNNFSCLSKRETLALRPNSEAQVYQAPSLSPAPPSRLAL